MTLVSRQEAEVGFLGKQKAAVDPFTLVMADYLVPSHLPTIPTEYSLSSKVANWEMLANDQVGDCTIAGALHLKMLWVALEGGSFVPTDADALSVYSEFTGYDPADPETDQGAVELDVLRKWRKLGILGDKIGAFAKVNLRNPALSKAALYLFNGLYIGVQLPQYAQKEGVNWTGPNGPLSTAQDQPGGWGGHCVILTGYNELNGWEMITWGQTGTVDQAFFHDYCDEAWAIVDNDYLTGNKSPEGIDVKALLADLTLIGKVAR